uniref:Uncharacterized protein n=1 Tax=Ixodes ricinus TaxID=34613 RepID=A0A6B0TTC8_IXORI
MFRLFANCRVFFIHAIYFALSLRRKVVHCGSTMLIPGAASIFVSPCKFLILFVACIIWLCAVAHCFEL